ncbi:L,D-transpeptidase ErfK/SrfK [Azospirillum agricola]|uniref:L,D-transpeptidase n=1 Tax=Azospirillum agricola TaxID=1720247 RepID=UPI002D7FF040|nr:L,D-transpeptidase [Azospirillum agricola]MBP2232105.1 L,D-transpeptidase ErfK/SrfK [Azospirillum agricola]
MGTPTARIVISLADRRLNLLEPGREARSFPVAIGRPGVAIPLGDSAVIRKRRNPTWRPTAAQRRAKPSLPLSVPPGPGNPLGRFALDLGWAAIAIHGTNEPDSVGRRASAGCFRMLPADIEALFDAVPVGTPVRVQRDSTGIHPTVEAGAAPTVRPAGVSATAPVRATASPPSPLPPPVLPPSSTVPDPPPSPVPDPRCPTATAPLRRLICDTPALSVLDGRARGLQERFLAGLPDRAAAAYALLRDERRFDDRITALCWIRLGSESDPAVAAAARSCLAGALSGRLDDVAKRIAELQGGGRMAGR